MQSGASSVAVSPDGASPGGRRLSRSFHSCLRGADHEDQESGTKYPSLLMKRTEKDLFTVDIRCVCVCINYNELSIFHLKKFCISILLVILSHSHRESFGLRFHLAIKRAARDV